jgi:DNA-binding SARP family transcriptional activator
MLGAPSITWDGQPLRIPRQQVRLLLHYLATQSSPVNRNTLTQLLWPEHEEAAARKLLREALSKLKAALPDPTLLKSTGRNIWLDPEKSYSDMREFERLIKPIMAGAVIESDARLPDMLYQNIRDALALCRGSMTISDINPVVSSGMENYSHFVSQTYDHIRISLQERLTSHCIAKGDLTEALFWLSRLHEIDPFSNENNYLMVSCLKDSGREKDALDYIGYLENLYSRMTGQTFPETINSLKTVLQQQNGTQTKEPLEWPGMEQGAAPFVGREDLLARIENAYNRKGIISVRGPSGIGKNRLVQEFFLNLQRKPRLIFCTGRPLIGCAPFEPLIEGLRMAVKPEEWQALPYEFKDPLRGLFPELQAEDSGEDTESPKLEAQEDFLRICAALHHLLVQLAQKKPLLMVMDIFIWVDDATMDFLSYLSDRGFFKAHGLLILVSRKEESSLPFEVFVDRNQMTGMLEMINVPPLTRFESDLLVQRILGVEPSRPFLQKFYLQTGGNPYFITEGLKSLHSIDFHFQEFTSASLFPVPDSIKALINEKTRLLPETTQKVLWAGSILGQFFKPEVVEVMEEIPTDEMVSALEELEKLSILSIRQDSHGNTGYFFDHNQIREEVLRGMSPLRKRHLHLQAVHALESVHGEKPELEAEYAYHFEEAGDVTRAFDAWLKAADFARTRFSKSDRYFAYDRANALIDRLPQNQLVEKIDELVYAWGTYAYDISDVETCVKVYDMCLEFGEQTQNPVLLCNAWNGIARVKDMKLEVDAGLEAARRAQFYCDRIDSLALKLETAARLIILLSEKNEVRQALKTGEEALQALPLIKSNREMDAMVVILTQLGFMYLGSGWPKKAVEVADKGLNLSLLVKRRSAKVQAAAVLAAGQYYCGEYQKSLQNALAVRDLAERLNYRWWLSSLDVVIAKSYRDLGEIDKSWFHGQQALEREKGFEYGGIYSLALSQVGDLYRLFGETNRALELFQEGMVIKPESYMTLECAYMYGLVTARIDPNRGISILDEVIAKGESAGLGMITLPAKMAKCLIRATIGDINDIQKGISSIAGEMNERGFMISDPVQDLIMAMVEKKEGNLDSARIRFKRVLEAGEVSKNYWFELYGATGLMSLVESGEERKRFLVILNNILAKIDVKTTHRPLRRLFYIFRKRMLEM